MNSPFNNSLLRDWLFEDYNFAKEFSSGIVTLGSGPFEKVEFDNFLDEIGITVYAPRETIVTLVLGEKDWEEKEIDEQIELRRGNELRVYSQEMFLTFLASGKDPYEDEHLLLEFGYGHPALDYLKTNGFDWPSTSIVPGDGHSLPVDPWPKLGLLKYLGYQVGKNGISVTKRHDILERVFESKIPNVNTTVYMESWGNPKSGIRLKKLADSLATFSKNAQNKSSSKMNKAIQDWENDLAWLKNKYYHGKFTFKWPS